MDLTQITLQHKVHILHTGNGTHNCSAGFREREAIPHVRPLPIPHLHDCANMEVCLVNFNKVEDDEGCSKFCNILKWSVTV